MPKNLPNRPTKENKLVPISTAADFLGVSIDTVRRWDKAGKLHSKRPNGKDRLFSFSELQTVKSSEPLSITQVAEKLQLSVSTLRRLEKKNIIKPKRDENGVRLYDEEVINNFLKSDYYLGKSKILEIVPESIQESPRVEVAPIAPVIPSPRQPVVNETEYQRIVDDVLKEQSKKISQLNHAKRIIFSSMAFIATTSVLIVSLITTFFLLFPQGTSEFFGYNYGYERLAISSDEKAFSGNTQGVLGASVEDRKAKNPLGSALKPFSIVSLRLVKNIDPDIYQQVVPPKAIEDVNDIFAVNEAGDLVVLYDIKFPDNVELKISQPESIKVENVDAISLLGKVPGSSEGNIAVFGSNGTIEGLTITESTGTFALGDGDVTGGVGGLILDGSIVTADLADESITVDLLASDSVTSEKIEDETVATEDLADEAVTSAKIKDGAVTASQLAASLTFSDGDFLNLSAILHNDSGLQGLILPNVSSSSPTSPASGEGYLAYDILGNQVIVFNGSAWVQVGPGDITGVTVGNGLSGGGVSGDLSINLDVTTAGTTSTTSSNSGLEVNSDGLSLLRGCLDNQIIKWDSGSGVWQCESDSGGGGSMDIEEDNSLVVSAASSLDFLGSDFSVTNSPSGEANVSIDYSNSKIVRSDQTETVSAGWTFSSTIDSNGNLSIADTDIVLDGASTNFTSTGDISFNTNDIFIDKDTGRVGIGTTQPSTALEVSGTTTATTFADGTATLSSGVLDLGTNTFYDGNLTGNWAFNSGNATGINNISAGGTVTFSGIGTGTDNSVLIVNGSGSVLTDEIDSRVWGSSLVDYSSSSAGYVSLFSDTDTVSNSSIFESGGSIGIGTTAPTDVLHVAGPILATGGLHIGVDSTDTLLDDAGNGSGSTTLYIGNESILASGDIGVSVQAYNANITILGATISKDELENSGTLSFDWDDSEIADTLSLETISGTPVATNGLRIGTDTTDYLIDDATNGTSSATLYIGNESILASGDIGASIQGYSANTTILGSSISLADEVTGTLDVDSGGTGVATITSNGILYGNGTGAIQATAAGTNGYILYSNNGTPAWLNPTSLNAGQVDGLEGTDFLRANANDEFETGNTLTFTGAIDSNGNLSIADTDIALDGTSTNFAATGNLSINTDDLVVEKSSGYVGVGTTNPSYSLDVAGSANLLGFYLSSVEITSTGTEINLLDGRTGTLLDTNNVSTSLSAWDQNSSNDVTTSDIGVSVQAYNANTSVLGSAIDTSEITNDSILEIDLDATNAPTDDYILTFDNASGGFTWIDPSTIGGTIDGSGAAGYTALWSDSNTLASSSIYETGGQIGIGTTSPSSALHVIGAVTASTNIDAGGTIQAGSGNITLTDSTGYVLHDSLVDCTDGQILKWTTGGGRWGCDTDETTGGGGSLDTAYNSGGTVTVDAYDVLFDLNDATNDYAFVIDNNTTGEISTALEFTTAGVGGTFVTAIDASDSDIVTALAIGTNTITTAAATIASTELDLLDSGIALSELTDSGTLTAGTVDINGGAIDGVAIGATSASSGAFTTLSSNNTVTFSGLGAGTDNSVIVLNSSNQLVTDEIDPDVWTAGTLLDGNGTGNYLAKYSDSDTLSDSLIYDTDSAIGIGTTAPSSLFHVAGTLTASTLDLGTNTITDGNLNGNWAFNSGNVSGIGTLAASSTVTFSGLGTGTDNSVVVVNGSSQLVTDEIDARVWGSTLLDYATSTAGYISKFSDADTATNSVIYETSGNIGVGTTSPTDVLQVAGQIFATTGFHVGADSDNNLVDDASNGAGSTTLYIGNESILASGDIGASVQAYNANTTVLGSSIGNSELDNDTVDFDKIANSLTLDEETTISAGGALNLLIGNNVTFTTTGTGAITATDLSCTNCIGATEISDLALGTDTSGDYVASFTAGNGLTGDGSGEGSTPTIAVGAGTGITVNADDIAINQATAFSWTSDHTWTLADTEDLAVNVSISGTNSGQGEVITVTNSSDSGNQYGLVVDNAASTGTTESLLRLDNSDTDTSVTNAIEFVDGGGTFTNLFNVNGTAISSAEFTLLDGGIALSELTDSGTLTATTVDINGGAIDGATVGANSASSGAFTTLSSTSTVTFSGLGTGTDNSVVILNGSNQLTTDEIDARVWGASLVDFSSTTANYVPLLSDEDTIINSSIYETGNNVGIGGTAPSTAPILRVLNAGTVGIGITTPTDTLHVVGQVFGTGGFHVGADSTDNLIDDASNGAGSTTLYIGNESILASGDIGVSVQGYNANTTVLGASIGNSELDNDSVDFDKIANSLTLDEETTISAGGALNLLIGNNVTFTTTGTGAINATDLSCTNCIGATEISDLALGTDTSGNYVASFTAGNGLTGDGSGEGSTPTIAVGQGTGITVGTDDISVDQATAFTWTSDHTWNLAETEDLSIALSISGTSAGQGQLVTITNSSGSGNQYGIVVDNAASSGTTESLLRLDNSDIDTAVTNAIEFVDAGGTFTNLFNVNGTVISTAEFTVLSSGIALSELTNSGTLTATTVDINGGAIDGVTIGGASAGAGTFTQATITTSALAVNSDSITADGATLTINAGGTVDIQDALVADSLSIDTGNLDVAGTIQAGSGNITLTDSTGYVLHDALVDCADTQVLKWSTGGGRWGCAADATGGSSSLDDAYNNGSTITVDAADILLDLNDATSDYGLVIDNNTTGAIATALEFTTAGVGGTFATAIDASDADIVDALNVGANNITGAGYTITATASGLTINSTSANLAFTTTTSGDITFTPSSATALTNVLTGNLKVGDGTPGVTQNGEDAYIEGTLEVDSAVTFDNGLTITSGALAINSDSITADGATLTINAAGTVDIQDALSVSGGLSGVTTLASSGDWTWSATTPAISINATEVFTVSDGTDTFTVNTSGSSFSFTDGSNSFTFDVDSGPLYAGNARPTRQVTLTPEYPGAVLTGTGNGIMVSDYCELGATGGTDTNTAVCNTSGDIHNYYQWDQTGGSAETYSIYIRWRVPDNFAAWASNPIDVYGKRTDVTNNAVTVSVYDTAGTIENSGGTQVAGTVWTSTTVEATFAGTYTPGSYMTIQITMTSDTGGDTVEVGEINLDYLTSN